jgi:hypothetical protein
VWFDSGRVLLKGSRSGYARLRAPQLEVDRRLVASSASAVAAAVPEGEEGHFVAGLPPDPLRAISQPRIFAGSGCLGWEPGTVDFVLAGDYLVAAGQCHWENSYKRQPLFVKSLRGGRWRVLRWLPGEAIPVLAAEGESVAVGIHRAGATMRVSILDLPSGRIESQFDAPEGHLSFASRNRLLISVPQSLAQGHLGDSGGPYRLSIYSTRGQRVAEIGSAREPPVVSAMHLVSNEEGTISVRDWTGGSTRAVIGFNEARELDAFAFRWPMLAVVESTRVPLAPSEVGCWTGEYGPPGKPLLQIIDLARSQPFLAPPPLAHTQPLEPLTPGQCGPAPP